MSRVHFDTQCMLLKHAHYCAQLKTTVHINDDTEHSLGKYNSTIAETHRYIITVRLLWRSDRVAISHLFTETRFSTM